MGEYSSNAKNSAFKEARLQDIKIDGGDYVQSASSDLTIPQNDAIDVYDISSEYSNEKMNEEMKAALQKIEEKLKKGEEFTSEDLAPLVGMMTEEQYDLFIQGLQATYDGYIDYYDGLLNGVDGQEGFADSLKDLNDFIENLKLQNVDPDQLLTLPQFEKEFEKYKNIGNGIHNYKELLAYQQELTQAVSLCQQQLNDYTNKKTSAPYDYLYFTKEFMEYEYEDHTKEYEKDLGKSISSKEGYSAQGGTAGATYSKQIYSYEKFKKMHPDVTPLQYVRMVEKNVTPGIGFEIEGVGDVENLKQLAHIYDERPEFGKMYEFLYQQDPAKAKDYMKGVKYQTNSVEGAVMAKEFQEDLQKFNDMNHLSEALSNELGVHIQGLKDGVITFEEGSENAIEALLTGMKKVSGDGDADGNRVMSVEEYKRMYILESLLSTEQKEKAGLITKDANGKYVNTDPNSIIDFTKKPKGVLLSNNYELSQGFGNMIPSIATSYICPFLGSAVMGFSAGGNAYHSAMVEGQSYGASLGYGMFTGASEAITERLLGGLPGLSNKTVTGLNRTYARAVVGEGVQEGFQGFLDSVARNFLFGEDFPSTPEDAMDYAKDLGKQAVYGSLTALFMQAPHAVRNSMSVNQFNNYLNTNGISAPQETVYQNSTNEYLNQIKQNDSSMDISHINPATAADVLALQQIALQEGKTLSEYGSQRSESKISPETQFEADALASKVRMQAELVEPQITSDMKGLESGSKKLTGLDYRLKGETSLSRKILSDAQFENIPLQEAASNIGDSVRYTLLCPEATYSTDVVESLEELVSKGYKIRKFKNTFTSDVYRGINVSMESPDGTVFELQFHTDESFNTKENLNHLFYEIARNDFTSPEAKTLANRIMKQNTTSVKIPEGVEKINIMQSFKDQGYNLMEVMPLQIESELDKARAKYPNLTSGQVETLRQVLLNDPSMDMSNLVVS